MAKIGTAHIEIKPVLNAEALTAIEDALAAAIQRGIERGSKPHEIVVSVDGQVLKTIFRDSSPHPEADANLAATQAKAGSRVLWVTERHADVRAVMEQLADPSLGATRVIKALGGEAAHFGQGRIRVTSVASMISTRGIAADMLIAAPSVLADWRVMQELQPYLTEGASIYAAARA